MADEPHVPDWNAALELARAARRCGARRRADGCPCTQPAMANGRCRFHGGKSTGPRTSEGLERSRKANWKHGYYSAEAKAARVQARADLRRLWDLLKQAHEAGQEPEDLPLQP
jgi:hypothetical protein